MEPIITTAVVTTAGWSGAKLLGPTLENMGKGLNQLCQKGIDKIIANATKKLLTLMMEGKPILELLVMFFGMDLLLTNQFALNILEEY